MIGHSRVYPFPFLVSISDFYFFLEIRAARLPKNMQVHAKSSIKAYHTLFEGIQQPLEVPSGGKEQNIK